jgi:hypothetical protein
MWTIYRRAGKRRVIDVPAGATDGTTPPADWPARAARYAEQMTDERARELASQLGVAAASLRELGAGYDARADCWTFPERDPAGRVVGIQRRYRDGRKRMIKGGRRGLCLPRPLAAVNWPVFLVEGPSDVAALRTLGLDAIGRPWASGGLAELASLFEADATCRPIVVVAEDDRKPDGSWPGMEGALATAEYLARSLGRQVLFALPPDGAKDVRAWLAARGADPEDADAMARLGRGLRDALLADSREAVPWDAPLRLDEHELPPFPVGALSDWAGQYVAALAVATQTPVDLAAMQALAALAAALAKKFVVRVKPDYAEPVNLYVLVEQPPAARKSAVFRAIARPLWDHERRRLEAMAPEIAARRNALKIAERRLEELQRKAAKTGDEADRLLAEGLAKEVAAMRVPPAPREIADDVTPERATTMLVENGGRLAILSPEGGIFGQMTGRYSAGKQAHKNLDVFLKGHAGDALRVDRVNRPPDLVESPALTLGLAVQPDVTKSLAADPSLRGRGVLGRFLYAKPRSLVGGREVDPPPAPEAVEAAYLQKMRVLLELPLSQPEGDEPADRDVTLSDGAYAAWREFSAWLEPQLGDFGPLAAMGDWGGKLAGAVARIAGLLHAADLAGASPPWSAPMPEGTMRRAVVIGRYLIPHARAAYAEMGADPAIADARLVLAWIRRRGERSFGHRECFEGVKGHLHTVDALGGTLELLERHGYIRKRPSPERRGRGRPAGPTFDVNPAVFKEAAPAGGAGSPGHAQARDVASAHQVDAQGPAEVQAHVPVEDYEEEVL